ncbi:hypothetical protein ACWEF6_13840 [Amycolatopsis sp. NPDC004772]
MADAEPGSKPAERERKPPEGLSQFIGKVLDQLSLLPPEAVGKLSRIKQATAAMRFSSAQAPPRPVPHPAGHVLHADLRQPRADCAPTAL